MKKKVLSVILTLVLTVGTCSIAAAADRGSATRNSLKSYGAIEYHKGNDKVIISAEDLYMLADQIDQVKLEVADQLEAMNTYFTAGDGISLDTDRYISVTHTRPSKTDFIDPVSVDFVTLLEGIAASQSVSSDVTDYGYSAGTKLYKGANGELTTNGSGEGAEQISVAAATADNLSAGTVAWVNGRLILGTGGDNRAYFDSGYDKGTDNSNDPNEPNDPSDSGNTNNANVIRLENSYLVTENMADVYLNFYGTKKAPPVFTTTDGDTVAFQEITTYTHSGIHVSTHADTTLYNTLYYVPELKSGTTITGFSGVASTYLFTAKDSDQGGKYNMETLDKGSHLITKDIKNVFMVLDNSDANGTPPNFNVQQSAPLVKIKNIVNSKAVIGVKNSDDKWVNKNYYNNIFYIPVIKAGTQITNIKGTGYIVY